MEIKKYFFFFSSCFNLPFATFLDITLFFLFFLFSKKDTSSSQSSSPAEEPRGDSAILPRFQELLLKGKRGYGTKKAILDALGNMADDVAAGQMDLVDLSLLAAATDASILKELAASEDLPLVCDGLLALFMAGKEVHFIHFFLSFCLSV